MSNAMELSQESLETIGSYIRHNLPTWLEQMDLPFRRERDIQLTERIVRVEEELKAQRELMQQGFAAMEKRFEQVERRFEEMNRRFADSARHINRRLATIVVVLTLIGLMGGWGLFVN